MKQKEVIYTEVKEPIKDCAVPVMLSDKTIQERVYKVINKMKERKLDKLVIYCDVEHGYNFKYLVGYYTRFEEALLIIDKSGKMTLMLGNENLNKAKKARIACDAIHVSLFSLPNQPNRNDKTLKELLIEAGIKEKEKVGMVGWKNFTSTIEENELCLDVPAFITNTISSILGKEGKLTNETSVFIGENGVRTINNANEIAHYEYGASLAGDCILDAMNKIQEGSSELEIADCLTRYGQHTSVTTIASSGERFIKGNMFPVNRNVCKEDPISLTIGYAGGSSSRAGMAVKEESDSLFAKSYMEEMAKPYFNVYGLWLENIHIGMKGKELFNFVDEVFPRKEYGWSLCPGHLSADEEWMSSPVYENSEEILKSGMIFQIDIIPSKKGMSGVSAESTIVLADEKLKEEIKKEYPKMWERMQKRISYLKEELHIDLSEDVLPMCCSVGYLRPYLLEHKKALRFK